jgi:peptidoglycan/xylan/chitin deacetylase (PgdA/CDA1 family)
MYHDVGRAPAGEPYPELFTSPSIFRAQLRALAAHGYRAVTLERVFRAWHHRASLPRRPIVLSFDDGFRGIWSAALPALRARRWPGVLFLLLHHLDQPGRWDLATRQVRQLLAAGWELDAHGLREVDLTAISSRAVWNVVHGSRVALRRRFGVPVSFYCYPVGAHDRSVIRLVRRAGYRGAVTTVEGYAQPRDDQFALPRIRVDGNESPAALLASLRSGAR